MRRLIPLSLLTAAMCAAGCSTTYPEEKEGWSAADWKKAQQENEQRLIIEDKRRSDDWLGTNKAMAAIGDQMVRFYNFIVGETPFDAAKNLLDPYYPDRRRQAIVYLSKRDYGRQEPYVRFYGTMARTDTDHTVQSMAVRALNRARAANHTALYIQSLEDKNVYVRIEAAKALANIPEPLAVSALTKHLNNPEESVDVRVACADALRCYRNSEVALVLISVLRDREFGVSWQARWSLKLMTGKDYRYDQAAWPTYLGSTEKPFG